jgi:hypothetical protein
VRGRRKRGYDAAMHTPRRSIACATVLVAALSSACAPEVATPPVPPTGVAASPSPPPVAPAAPPSAPSTATEVLVQGRAPFDACYARARASNPELGRTHVDIIFTRDGGDRLTSVELKYRNRFDEGAKDCMRTAAEAITFPATLHGTVTGTLEFGQ